MSRGDDPSVYRPARGNRAASRRGDVPDYSPADALVVGGLGGVLDAISQVVNL